MGSGPSTLSGFIMHRLWAEELNINMFQRSELPWDLVEEYEIYMQLLVQKRMMASQPKGAPRGR